DDVGTGKPDVEVFDDHVRHWAIQPLTAPAVMPRTNQRPETRYTASGSSEVSTVAAMLTLYWRSPVLVLITLLSCTVIGRFSRPANTRPRRKSFQMLVICMITATATMGTDMGSIRWKKMRQKPPPSMRAALKSSIGTPA